MAETASTVERGEVTIRDATLDDVDFVAWVMQTAARSHLDHSIWEYMNQQTEEEVIAYMAKLAVTETVHLFHHSLFLVAEVGGRPAAAMCGYDPETEGFGAYMTALKRPQPYLIALLASGQSPVYPCHVTPAQMRQHPVGTGPFKFVEYKQNEHIRVVKNPDYWKPGLPHLDGIETTIIPNISTRLLAFVAGKFDLMQATMPLLKDIKSQVPQVECDVVMDNNSRDLLINRAVPPFDSLDLRRAMALSLDRQAFIDILAEGQGAVGGSILPPPDGVWGMTPDVLQTLPGYGPDVAKNRAEAREIMKKLGYGPDKPLSVKMSTRDVPGYRDAAILAISQLREIWIDSELEPIDTANWFPRVIRKDYKIGVTVAEGGLDEPDQKFYETYVCGADRNYSGYCNPETDKLIDQQSSEANPEKRRKLVWEVERRLAEDASRPVLFYSRFPSCRQSYLKGQVTMTNSRFNGWRMEDVWLDR